MRKSHMSACLVLAVALSAAGGSLAATYTAVPLNPPTGLPESDSYASGINNLNESVGRYYAGACGITGVPPYQAGCQWNSSAEGQLLTRGGHVGDFRACDISDSGLICGIVNDQAIVWNPDGSVSQLETPTGCTSWPYSINNSGIVVGLVEDQVGHQQGGWWDATGAWHQLTADGTVTDVNDAGVMLGSDSGMVGLWDAMGWHELGEGYPGRLNAHNVATGRSADGQACKWDSNGQTLLPWLPGDWRSGTAFGINDAGVIVGRLYQGDYPADPFVQGCYWDSEGVHELPSLPCLTESYAYAINNNGWIVGYCCAYGSTNYRATLWRPVPEPGSFVGLVCALAGLAVTSRRSLLKRRK